MVSIKIDELPLPQLMIDHTGIDWLKCKQLWSNLSNIADIDSINFNSGSKPKHNV